jgi:hypothetical protein
MNIFWLLPCGYLLVWFFTLLYNLFKGRVKTKRDFWVLIIPFGETIFDIYHWYKWLKDPENWTQHDLREHYQYNPLAPYRITAKLAKELLQQNIYMIKDGQTYYYKLVNLGLGVYEVTPIHMAQLSSTKVFKD